MAGKIDLKLENTIKLPEFIMNRKISLVLVVLMALTLSACSGKKDVVKAEPTTNDTKVVSDGDQSNAYGTGYSASQLRSFGIEGNPLDYNVVYFEYNSTAIDTRSNIIASAHARALSKRSGTRVTLEGHADERGTRDYNLALGERRANQVAELMRAIGARNNIQTLSYGEERPAESAHNEAAWQKNRRVKISY